jgi:hypothetical protein
LYRLISNTNTTEMIGVVFMCDFQLRDFGITSPGSTDLFSAPSHYSSTCDRAIEQIERNGPPEESSQNAMYVDGFREGSSHRLLSANSQECAEPQSIIGLVSNLPHHVVAKSPAIQWPQELRCSCKPQAIHSKPNLAIPSHLSQLSA